MLLLACLTLALVGAQEMPSPCPGVVQYSYDGGRWSVIIRVPVPVQPRRMVVVASLFVIDVLLPPEHPGELQILQDERKVKEQIRKNLTNTVVYVLELPIQNPLPIIDKIKINRNVICQGPTVKARNRTKVTYTHRLNGLTPQSSEKPVDQHNIKHGRILGQDKKYNPKNFKEQETTLGSKVKGKKTYHQLELMENEVVEVMTQEEDIFPKYKTEGRNFNTELDEDDDDEEPSEVDLDSNNNPEWSDDDNVDEYSSSGTRLKNEDEENISVGDLDRNEEAEILDSKIPDGFGPNVQNTPNAETPDYGEDVEEEQGTSNNVLDPNEDAEMLDNNTPGDEEEEDEDKDDDEDTSDYDLDLTDDAEMLDNEISEAGGFKPKTPDPAFKTSINGEFEDSSDNELKPNYNVDESDNVIFRSN